MKGNDKGGNGIELALFNLKWKSMTMHQVKLKWHYMNGNRQHEVKLRCHYTVNDIK